MFSDFLKGVTYITSGCKAFYGDRKAWKYVVVPLIIIFFIYSIAFWGIIYLSGRTATRINELMSVLPDWLSWLYNVVTGISYTLGTVISIIILGTTICIFYEMFGGLFFDSLVAYYEQKKYGTPIPHPSFIENLLYCFDSVCFGVRTAMCFIFLFIVSLFFPFAGQILLALVMGYYLGISYMICSASNNRISIAKLRQIAYKKCSITLGFGVTAYVLLLIPFSTIFLLPGLVLGGSELFNNELKELA